MIRYEIHTANGCYITGSDSDFLAVILKAKKAKARALADLPFSRFRVRIVYPNGSTVTKADIKSALQALANKAVYHAVESRLRVNARGADRRNEDRTAGVQPALLSVAVGSGFCQAGVVAPPDSPDFGNPVVFSKGKFAGRFAVKSRSSHGV
ncbi:hypothetical protein [Oxalicibacterium faecigallinarum]|uniref:Uncharacterized protein n=1 Tax=Oxalicibacterium faecigallinarum TaxID=573741 RepID=A0A8J3ASG6_9BURK|nr:hypothetical protein [Oxalicibacterium faecigallinarum]GGI21081.1 hypothetical protein GCM10008066_27280 [Oxalicibacterium faecigallinarum]